MLSDAKCRRARCPDGKRQIKISDERGLYLLVTYAGGRYWRMNYRYGGKQKTLAIGVYPEVSLAEARNQRNLARKILRDGRDPAVARRIDAGTTFRAIADEWLQREAIDRAATTVEQNRSRLAQHILPRLGDIPVAEIRASDILRVLEHIDARGTPTTAHRCRSLIGQILRYAIATGRCESDPTPALRGAIRQPPARHMPALLDPAAIGCMLDAIMTYHGHHTIRHALMLLAYTFVRPGELRHAAWDEFDMNRHEWRIPDARMKMRGRGSHIVPLSRQALQILDTQRAISGHCVLVFPGIRDPRKPLSDNTLNSALRRMGVGKDQHVAHGFRAMARSLLAEHGWRPEIIERQLAHQEQSKVVAAYARAEHMDDRRAMMQEWADYLDSLTPDKKTNA